MQRNMLPHRLEQNLSFCPRDVTTYAALHLDTMAKILNHLLLILLVFNILLFLSCWSQSLSPGNTLPVLWISFFLLLQNGTVWAILNNARVPSTLSFLSPNDFTMGLALGITIGASILSFILSQAFQKGYCTRIARPIHSSATNLPTDDDHIPSFAQQQQIHSNAQNCSSSIWLWAGLVFWINFCASLLLAIGRREFSQFSHYEPIGGMEESHMYSSGATTSSSYSHQAGTTFAGDYANVPEVRHDHSGTLGRSSSHGSSSVASSDAAKVLSV